MAAAASNPFSLAVLAKRFTRAALLSALVGTLGMAGMDASARSSLNREDAAALALERRTIAVTELPSAGQRTYRTIFAGGPFRYDKDGSVFGNRERQLPRERRGHYREYTVDTPGSRHRGARRIVCGGATTVPESCWYSDDHYASFRKIVP